MSNMLAFGINATGGMVLGMGLTASYALFIVIGVVLFSIGGLLLFHKKNHQLPEVVEWIIDALFGW